MDELRFLAARCLIIGFDGKELTDEARALIADGVGGVILFRRNVESAEQVRALTDSIREAAPAPVVVSVDQEGGRVERLRGIATSHPPMREVAGRGQVAAVAGRLAIELDALGFDLDWAPVVDVDTRPDNPVIGDRSPGSDPAEVARHAVTFIETLQSGGIAACAKHFPGHGDTHEDSHFTLPRVDHDLDRLRRVELVPFRAAVDAGVAAVMTAHVVVARLDSHRPATMSPEVIGLLRDELGHDGLVVSDDLEMAAVADRWPVPEAAEAALAAGVDAVMVCHQAARQRDAIVRIAEAVESGRLPRARLEQAAARVDAVARRWAVRPRRRPVSALGAGSLAAASVPSSTDPTGDR